MAGIVKRKEWFYVRFSDCDGKRHSVALETKSQRKATQAKLRIEELVSAAKTGQAIDSETKAWVSKQKPAMQAKLAKYGLIESPADKSQATLTLGQHLDNYFARRSDVKDSTQESWQQSRRNLVTFFGADKLLASVTAGDARDFERYLKTEAKNNAHVGTDKAEGLAQTRHGNASVMPSSFSVMPWNMKSLTVIRLPN